MFVFINPDNLEDRHIIVNDPVKLAEFYEQNKEQIFIGYNARSYDQFIFKAILCGIDPKKVNDYIILDGNKGGTYSKKFREIELLIYDCMIDKMKSLKQLEAFMGNDIQETSVDFNIKRKLTQAELELTKKYCIHDVEQTIEVFKRQPEELESQKSLVEAFNLPKNYMNKTKAQLSSIILEAYNDSWKFDDFEISFPETLVLSNKYQYVYDWYVKRINRNYAMSLKTDVYGVPHIFAWGGIHGAVANYIGSGFYVMSDVASLYPSIMIEYGYLSRNVPDAGNYKRIRDRRLVLKKEKNPMQLPYKIVLNSTYGASKDKYNNLFDPLMANNVCVCGQLLLLDLIDKLEQRFGDKCELIQSNTDGILVKLPDSSYFDEYQEICNDWSKRTRLDLEHDVYVKVFQKDVNNYIIVSEDGHYKSKGAYVKKLNDLDYDLPVVNKALIAKLVNDIEISDFIKNCNDLKEFQKVVKVGKDYECGYHGDLRLSERVLRVFASTKPDSPGVFKFRHGEMTKIGNTPEHAFIDNSDINKKNVPNDLDKSWYIDLANKRYDDFINSAESTDDSVDIFELLKSNYSNFSDVIIDVLEKSHCKPKDFRNLIISNYFYRFGTIKKLLRWYELYKLLYNKKSIAIDRLESNGINVEYAAKFGNLAKKNITKLNGTEMFNNIVTYLPDEEYSLREIVNLQLDKLESVTYIDEKLESTYSCVSDIEVKGNEIVFTLRSFKQGKRAKFKINGKNLAECGLRNGSVIKIKKYEKEYWIDYMGKDDNGKSIYKENKKKPIYHLYAWEEVGDKN